MNTIINIPFKDIISSDESFRISYGEPLQRLICSIQMTGILQPLWAKPSNQKYSIVLGYKRLHAAQRLKMVFLPCRIVDDSLSDADLLLANIYENLATRELAPLEAAGAMQKSVKIFGKEKTISEIMPALGLKPSASLLQRMTQILDLPNQVLNLIHQNELMPANALVFLALETSEQLALCNIFENLKPGVNLQRELLENIIECSRRDTASISEILQRSQLSDILSDDKTPTQARVEQFRAELRRLRYPRLNKVEARFQDLIETLRLPPEIRLSPPPSFEGADFHACIRFKSPDELLTRLDRMANAFASPEIKKMFGLLR
ncbi:MAG TPA: ParB/RepB/Spo0J family partition protein [Candidatus Sumerlaeota bacterium]|nr:MAG: putative chromosome-partitioning protein ParB [candidate division BRC1 bacterium ADurb.Bin183]HOE63542.1 ParB/RepB/Spo0J family partition protein [Candidatus Sumerlaeota bacterium]HRR30559.1 ParB/RepB/Spo0J family partition protein [Candidatus Sumerlaeia bacterium]HON51342.1 ParB/RepB/Spo0J family partition protein [Candidatus Sumerlaeota bacterium]HOR64604.1 ParB/RepB/Spo0J family partition protein [Candidatus Sumerlaeota bacterium]